MPYTTNAMVGLAHSASLATARDCAWSSQATAHLLAATGCSGPAHRGSAGTGNCPIFLRGVGNTVADQPAYLRLLRRLAHRQPLPCRDLPDGASRPAQCCL